MARFFRNEEYATSSHDVPELRVAKETLRGRDFPLEESKAVVRQYFDAGKFEHLRNDSRPIVYLVAPSTSGTNILPRLFAEELKANYPGEIVQGWATPDLTTRTAIKGTLRTFREPPTFSAVPEIIDRLPKNARLVLVDDVVTTGRTTRALREVLAARDRTVEDVLSIGQSELRKVNNRDITRIVARLQDPNMRPAVVGVLGGQLKHASNTIERLLNDNTRAEISAYFTTEYARLRQLGLAHDGTERGASISLGEIESAQRQAAPGTAIPAGFPGEGRSVRRGDDRAEGLPQTAAIVSDLSELRKQWAAAGHDERAGIVREGLGLVDELGGPGTTRIPLRVVAQDFLEGKADLDLLNRRAAEHVASLPVGRIFGKGRGTGIER